jgi:hypothetical protein
MADILLFFRAQMHFVLLVTNLGVYFSALGNLFRPSASVVSIDYPPFSFLGNTYSSMGSQLML